jgi:Group II intron, maturase-specific domain
MAEGKETLPPPSRYCPVYSASPFRGRLGQALHAAGGGNHHRSDLSLSELAAMYNPCIRGWIGYYGHFFKTQLRPTLIGIDAYASPQV